MSKNDEIEEIACTVRGETGKAWFLKQKNKPFKEGYFPKSQVSFARRNIRSGDAVAEIPTWLLNAKGWN